MWVLYANDRAVYAASDERRFWREVAKKYANCHNCEAKFVKPGASK